MRAPTTEEKYPPLHLFRGEATCLQDATDRCHRRTDARREAKRTRTKVVRRRTPTRRRQVVYDDFGEPLRVVWVEVTRQATN